MAFLWSVRALFALGERPYFWTFTTRDVVSVEAARVMWNKLVKSLWKYGLNEESGERTIFGLRVFELHPGGHGVHVHALLNRRLHIHAIRRRCQKFGFGWIHVVRVRSEEHAERVGDYLAKYLSKEARPECMKGVRMWAPIGKWGASKCGDVLVESECSAAFKARRKVIEAEAAMHQAQGLPYRREHNLETIAWARAHCHDVKTGKKAALTDCIRDASEFVEVEPTWDDWDGVFDDLASTVRERPKVVNSRRAVASMSFAVNE